MARENHYCEECNAQTVIYGSNRAEAARKLKWWQDKKPLCNECEGKKEYAAAVAKAAELDLLPLQGTPAQIEWAERIRTPRLASLMEMTEAGSLLPSYFLPFGFGEQKRDNEIEMAEAALPYLCTITSSEFWIDNSTYELQRLVTKAHNNLSETRKPANDPALKKAVEFETTIRPENLVTEFIATFKVGNRRDSVLIYFPEKLADFNEAVKAFNAQWQPTSKQWLIKLPAEQFEMQAAEIGLHLLGSGFSIRVPDTPLRELIQSGEVSKSEGRHIDYAGQDHFRVDWRRIDGDYYEEVRKIAGSKWDRDNKTVLVPVTSADDLRDFADANGFRMTDGATQAADAFDEYRRNGMIVKGNKRAKGKVEPILPSTEFPGTITIDASLLDS